MSPLPATFEHTFDGLRKEAGFSTPIGEDVDIMVTTNGTSANNGVNRHATNGDQPNKKLILNAFVEMCTEDNVSRPRC